MFKLETKKIQTKPKAFIKIHGGKWYLADWIISEFPSDYQGRIYIEPFIGGGAVYLKKKPSSFEIINDLHTDLMTLWNRCYTHSIDLRNCLRGMNYTEETFKSALDGKYWDTACREYVLRRMSRGGLKKHFSFSNRLRGGKPGDINAWLNSIENISLVNRRMHSAPLIMENKDFGEFLKPYMGENVLIYADPPYVHSTRKSKEAYEFEMTDNQHCQLGELLKACQSKVLISGYNCSLYQTLYASWNLCTKTIANNSGQNSKKNTRVECLWKNF